MSAINFKTKTKIIKKKNPTVDGYHIIGLDVGYSSVKGFSTDSVYCFPGYATKLDKGTSFIGEVDDKHILYRDNRTGDIWTVGEAAQKLIRIGGMSQLDSEIYNRYRYDSDMYHVVSDVGLGLSMMSGIKSDDKIKLQTGLPQDYLDEDKELIKESFTGTHEFSLKIGNGNWIDFGFELPENDISVISQPMGSLWSSITDINGHRVPDAKSLLKSNIHIFDGGFKTFDVIGIRNNTPIDLETFPDLGMKDILDATCDDIYSLSGKKIPVHAMQKYLQDGKIIWYDRKTNSDVSLSFENLLETNSHKLCMKMLQRTAAIYNNFDGDDNIILTGGTCAAWANYIKEYFSKRDSISVFGANRNDTALSHVFSNVRGYYMIMYQMCLKESRS